MRLAQSKRKENIAEYILLLWQIEDLLRALQFSPEAIYTNLVESMDLDDVAKQDELLWYTSIGNLLREEGKQNQGHLNHTMHMINDLNAFHLELLAAPQGARYRKLYQALSAELPSLKSMMGGGDISDIEICFRALYAAMLYRIKGAGSQVAQQVVEAISPLIAELASMFHQVERGEIDINATED